MHKPLLSQQQARRAHQPAGRSDFAGPHTQLKRHPERGAYDRATVFAIIDAAPLCHLAFEIDGRCMSLPTAHARIDDQLYLHGAMANRMLRRLRDKGSASATFTLVDGLVLARTAFHHSMNFRSAVVFGAICEVTDLDEKRLALASLIEHMAKGRMRELAPPSDAELSLTQVLRLEIEEASAKIRTGPPLDTAADHALDVWAGEVPLDLHAKLPVRDPALRPELRMSAAASARAQPQNHVIRESVSGDYLLSNDHARLQLEFVRRFLAEDSYWARGITREELTQAIDHSICFAVYRGDEQLAFARVVTDRARFAYLADVFVRGDLRGQGLGRELIAFVLEQPEYRAVKRFVLGTLDAHSFYEPFGWRRAPNDRYMVRLRDND